MVNQLPYQLGAIPSKHDRRDYSVASFFPLAEPKVNIPPKVLLPAMNQEMVGACVAFGLEHEAAIKHMLEHGSLRRFDPNYIYGNRFPEHYQGEGMIPREAYEAKRRNGISQRGKLPWDYPVFYSGLKAHPQHYTPEVHADAMYQRVESYFACNNEAEIDTALENEGVVNITIPVYQSFDYCPPSGLLDMPNIQYEYMRGYHLITVVGKKDRRWIVQNWWGNNWGDQSMSEYCMAYMPVNYPIVETWGSVDEALPVKDSKTIFLFINNPIANVNGVDKQIDPANDRVRPIIHEARTMLPVRFIAETMGMTVDWEQSTGKVTLKS